MTLRPRSIAAAITSLALGAGLAAAAAPAHADTTPAPWEATDTQRVGTLTFYDASGTKLTSGSTTTAPFAAYAVGSTLPNSGDTVAGLTFANPDPSSKPYAWYKSQVGLYTTFPVTGTSAPSSITGLGASTPVATGGTADETLSYFLEHADESSTAGYQDVVQVRLRTATGNQISGSYDTADLLVDPTTNTWTQIYPSTGVVATVPGSPTALTAKAGNASASLTWKAPASDGGSAITGYSVQKSADGGKTFTAVKHTGTSTSQTVTGLTNGTSYVFRVAAINSVGTGAYAESASVTPVADSSTLSISAPKSVVYGKTAKITGTLKDGVTKAAIGSQTLTLQQRTSSKAKWTKAGTAKTSSTGIASLTIKPGATRQYEWVFAGTSTHKAVTSAVVTVTVAQSLTVAVDHTSVKKGSTVHVYGTLNPAVTGRKVYLQQLVGKTWKNVATVTVKKQKLPNGKTVVGYSAATKLSSKATYTFRTYSPATTTPLAAATSGSVKVKSS